MMPRKYYPNTVQHGQEQRANGQGGGVSYALPGPMSMSNIGATEAWPGYPDYANVPELLQNLPNPGQLGRRDQSFPVRLHYLLTELEQSDSEWTSIVSWQPHGRALLVHKKAEFGGEVLPHWFSMTSYESFQRQLNLYGFTRMTKGMDRGGYYHPMFLASRPQLSFLIQRQKLKGRGPRKPVNPDLEPNFYHMAYARTSSSRNQASQSQAASTHATAPTHYYYGNSAGPFPPFGQAVAAGAWEPPRFFFARGHPSFGEDAASTVEDPSLTAGPWEQGHGYGEPAAGEEPFLIAGAWEKTRAARVSSPTSRSEPTEWVLAREDRRPPAKQDSGPLVDEMWHRGFMEDSFPSCSSPWPA